MTWSPGFTYVDLRPTASTMPARLVPEDAGRRGRIQALDVVQVAVADAHRHRPQQHLARRRRIDVDVLDRQVEPRPVKYRSLH